MHPVMHPFVYEASGVYGPGAGETGCGRGSECHLQKSGKQFHATL